MTYAEYRAHRLATVDEPRIPSTWRMAWPSGLRTPNDRAARRRAEMAQDDLACRRPSDKMIQWVRDGHRGVSNYGIPLRALAAIDRLFSAA